MLSKLKKKGAPVGAQSKAPFYWMASAGAGLLTLTILFSILSFILTVIDLPLYVIMPLSTISVCIASGIAGLCYAYFAKRNGMITGFCIGLAVSILLVILALIRGSSDLSQLAGIKVVSICASGAIGGYMGISLSERRRKLRP